MSVYRHSKMQSRPVAEQAAGWVVVFDEGDPDEPTRREFVSWMKQSPSHIEEFMRILSLHLEIADAPEKTANLETLIAEARTNVVTLEELASPPYAPWMKKNSRWTAKRSTGAAAGVAAIVVLTLGYFLAPTYDQVYRTGHGEQRSIVLEDGSFIELNTSSSVSVYFSGTERHAILLVGEVLFEIAKDPSRPFTVDAGPLSLEVIGTRFNVYRQPEQTVLTVIEGKVRVDPVHLVGNIAEISPLEKNSSLSSSIKSPDTRTSLQVSASQQVSVTVSGAIKHERQTDVDRATAWTERRLVFDDELLGAVLKEFNRYNRRPLILEATQLAERRITGVFNARNTETLLDFLAGQDGVQIQRTPDAIYIIAP